ncbi:uncharacterized protein cubi_00642 [Cryptosporidium ubiquitum]|uniref:Uncharacterized protein n=1 Tax=Cryptosporidium ubiquitum TaxID=857276 RepID=A0A1J4MC78_9CRYT|nr:uncharacterized protein cubi_00642 [Cryptosporidium ubiquitum]OII71834.1 hypothetical protein cubi_00642 [Cryptosporidium ubiquitum]
MFLGVFTLLCSGFSFSSLFAVPGVCSRSFEGLIKQSNGNISLILASAVLLIGIYLFFSGVGLINLSGCLIRLGMPSDYPNAVARAFMYSQFRTDSNCLKTELRDANVFFGINSGFGSKNVNKNTDLNYVIDSHYNTHILTLDGEHKKRFKMAMRTTKARTVLAIVSIMVIICASYASFVIFEGSQIFLESNSIILSEKVSGLLGSKSEFGNILLLLLITAISTVILNFFTGGAFVLCIFSWLNFFGLLFFCIISIYLINSPYKSTLSFSEFESKNIQFDWDVHIWGFFGGILEIGTFVISAMAFHIILPGAFKTFSDYEVKSSRIWGITISLILFIFLCETSVILSIVPSFPILPYGFEPSSEGIGMAWRILESKMNSNKFFVSNFSKRIFLLGNFFTWTLFVSIVVKCIDNIIRSISNQVECDFDSFSPNKNSLIRRYFLRSAKQQICGEEAHSKGNKREYLSNDQLEANKTFFQCFVKDLKTFTSRNNLLDLARYILNSTSAIGIIFILYYKLLSEPQLIPIFRSVSASIFSIVVLILPCAIFWFVFYSEMVPRSTSNFQVMNLIFFGRISSRYDRNCEKHRDRLALNNENCDISCNPLTFGFFSITLPVTLGCTILVYEISKIFSMFLSLRFNTLL